MPRITVVGSLNVDFFSFVEHLPGPGETVTARRSLTRFGGKGANQAVAAARLGADVSLIGLVGQDDPGRNYRLQLGKEGIDVSGVGEGGVDVPTGSASIAVEESGENFIIVNPGANGEFKPEHLVTHRKLVTGADALLLQLELPLETVLAAIALAHEAAVPVFLNPSPFLDSFPWGEVRLDSLVVNATEAAQLLGADPGGTQGMGDRLGELQIGRLVVTRGARPSSAFDADGQVWEVAPFEVTPVDTVGAGDTFFGAIAVALLEGRSMEEALRFANAAGGLATLQPGAQEVMPTRAEVDRFCAVP